MSSISIRLFEFQSYGCNRKCPAFIQEDKTTSEYFADIAKASGRWRRFCHKDHLQRPDAVSNEGAELLCQGALATLVSKRTFGDYPNMK